LIGYVSRPTVSSAVYLSSRALAWLVIQNRSVVRVISHVVWESSGAELCSGL
jgi:hypothetical protein